MNLSTFSRSLRESIAESYTSLDDLKEIAIVAPWRDGANDLEPSIAQEASRDYLSDGLFDQLDETAESLKKVSICDFHVCFAKHVIPIFDIDYKIVLGKSGAFFMILSTEEPDVIMESDLQVYNKRVANPNYAEDFEKSLQESRLTHTLENLDDITGLVLYEEEKEYKYFIDDALKELKQLYDKALSVGQFVSWKDDSYTEPRLDKTLSYSMRVDDTLSKKSFTGRINSQHPYLLHVDCLFANKKNYPMCVKGVEVFSSCSALDKRGNYVVTPEDIKGMKLLILNNGGFLLVEDGVDMSIVQDIDGTLIHDISTHKSGDTLEESYKKLMSGSLVGRFLPVATDVFAEYLKSYTSDSNPVKQKGETSLF